MMLSKKTIFSPRLKHTCLKMGYRTHTAQEKRKPRLDVGKNRIILVCASSKLTQKR